MKIGDKVRFLNEVGGGKIVGFKDKYTVLVEDETGFEVPMLVNDVVVVEETDDYNIVRKPASPSPQPPQPEQEPDPAERPVTFRPKPLERSGGERVNLLLAFLPVQGGDGTLMEAYFVNDSNYYVRFQILTQEGNACSLRHEGLAEPNTKLYLEEFERSALGAWERLMVQALCYKTDKAFMLKPAYAVPLRIEGAKFYKLHTFKANDFFDEAALLFEVVRDDEPAKTLFVDAQRLQAAMCEKQHPSPAQQKPARKAERADEPLIVDLHAAELLDTTAGMQPKDILDYQLKVFRDTMEEHRKHFGKKIVFIHGKGNGVLRQALLAELKHSYKHATAQDASFREYGFGATLVKV